MEKDILRYLKDEFVLSEINEVQAKRGVYVYAVTKDNVKYFLKYFENKSDAHEIECYRVLSKIDIATIKYYGYTSNAILLKDMNVDSQYRIGCADDYINAEIIKSVAKWFKKLHNLSDKINTKFSFLDEESVAFEKQKIMQCIEFYNHNEFFNLLLVNIIQLNDYLSGCDKIIIHDDFYYRNFFVDTDSSEVTMFDFNYMKKGLRSQELDLIRRNLRSGSENSEKLFVKEYGDYDELEYNLYTLWRHFDCLFAAKSLEQYPNWALESRQLLSVGKLTDMLKAVLKNLNRLKIE
ncbi:hypothetical protein EZV73_01910 [Acidaminobacter sp. JC074]|uniref:hypothetical protein n=1 Tax=Acidaminobacter sp. JC074 TaxID=2530199 RepID=UPI001F0FA80B|nr:hypothetical protein [Acidaminobacter sp. JC074]MCH4886300.1 hypothetical protein [Acidaminobacter sp. JC074]